MIWMLQKDGFSNPQLSWMSCSAFVTVSLTTCAVSPSGESKYTPISLTVIDCMVINYPSDPTSCATTMFDYAHRCCPTLILSLGAHWLAVKRITFDNVKTTTLIQPGDIIGVFAIRHQRRLGHTRSSLRPQAQADQGTCHAAPAPG
jgi:hypothetical protein